MPPEEMWRRNLSRSSKVVVQAGLLYLPEQRVLVSTKGTFVCISDAKSGPGRVFLATLGDHRRPREGGSLRMIPKGKVRAGQGRVRERDNNNAKEVQDED